MANRRFEFRVDGLQNPCRGERRTRGAVLDTGHFVCEEAAEQVVLDLLTVDQPPPRVQSSAWATEFVGPKLADSDGSGTFKALDDYLRLGD